MDAELVELIQQTISKQLSTTQWLIILVSFIAALLGAALGAYFKKYGELQAVTSRFEKSLGELKKEITETEKIRKQFAEDTKRFEISLDQEINFRTRYLYQLQDAVDSLWFRFENVDGRIGYGNMPKNYYEISTLYALGRVLAYSRILVLDGIYPQLELKLREGLRDGFESIDQSLKSEDFQHYDRLALAEAVMERGNEYLRTRDYLNFSLDYEKEDSLIGLSLKRASDFVMMEKESKFKASLGELETMAKLLEKETGIPSKIHRKTTHI